MVLDFPLALESIDGVARGHDVAVVEQRRIAADADQAAPGAGADELADFGFA